MKIHTERDTYTHNTHRDTHLYFPEVTQHTRAPNHMNEIFL